MGVGYLESNANKTICDVALADHDGGNGAAGSVLNSANLRTLLRIHRAVVLDSLSIDGNHFYLLSCAHIRTA